ncbi:MAG: hypothetical protein ACTSU6_04775 [Candidatus Njordarchaeales archaeon]
MTTEKIDYSSLQYFYEDKGDVTRWGDWEEQKLLIAVKHPEIIIALSNLDGYQRAADLIIKTICEENIYD